MNSPYKIERLKANATLEEWQRYYDFWLQCNRTKKAPLYYSKLQDFQESWSYWMDKGTAIFIVWKEEKPYGHFSFFTDFKEQADKRMVKLRNSLKEKVLNENLLELIGKAFLEFDPTAKFLMIPSVNGENDFVEMAVQAEVGNYIESYQLKIEEVDVAKMDEWIAVSEAKFSNYRLQFYEDIPDELLEEYSTVFSQLMKDVPANSRSFNTLITPQTVKERQVNGKKTQQCSYRYLIFNEANQLIAKTNVSLNKKTPTSMYQYMTGVLKPYRGQGLSKWLKAVMFKKLVADFPDFKVINTEVHTMNAASRALNLKMGYVKTGFKKDWLIPREKVVAFIDKELKKA